MTFQPLESRIFLSSQSLFHSTAALSQPRSEIATATVGNLAFFAGGNGTDSVGHWVNSNVLDIYNAQTGLWSATHLPTASGPLSATAVGIQVIFCDGPDVDVYDTQTATWASYELPLDHSSTKALTVGNKVVIIGASGPNTYNTPILEIYNSTSRSWTRRTLDRPAFDDAAVGDKAIFYDGDPINNPKVIIFDATTDSWSSSVLSRPHEGGTVAVVDGKALFAGSGTLIPITFDENLDQENEVDIYNGTTGEWSTSSLPIGALPTSAVVGDLAIFAGNNYTYLTPAIDGASTYNAQTGQWSTGMLSEPRTDLVSAVAGDNAIFMGTDTAADVYNAAENAWSVASIGLAREGTASVSVANTAIFAGGEPTGQYAQSAFVDLFSNSPIAQPVNPNIASGAGFSHAPGKFSWSARAGATSYDVYLDQKLVASVSSNHWQPAASQIGPGLHSWQVVARDGSTITAGARWTFVVGRPAKPKSPRPGNNAIIPSAQPILRWVPARGATSYQVLVDGRDIGPVAQSSLYLPTAIGGGEHAWQVIAQNAVGITAGPLWRFSTPVAPLLLAPLKSPTQMPGYAPALTVGNQLFIAGGDDYDPLDRVRIYNADDHQWSLAHLSTARADVVPLAVGSIALFAGGNDGYNQSSNVVDIYSTRQRRWSATRLPTLAGRVVARAIGAKAIFIGENQSGTAEWIDAYDTTTGHWTSTRISAPIYGLSCAVVKNKLLIVGETDRDYETPSDVVSIYDANTRGLSVAHLSVARDGPAIAVLGDKVIFAGGQTRESDWVSDAVDIYDASTGRWTSTTLSQPRENITSVVVGRFAIFAGGQTIDQANINAVDIYDSVTGKWSYSKFARTGATTFGLTLGHQAIFGLRDDDPLIPFPDRLEIFNAITGKWSVRNFADPIEFVSPSVLGDKLIVPSQSQGTTATVGVLEVFDTSNSRWSVAPVSSGDQFVNPVGTVGTSAVYISDIDPPYGDAQLIVAADISPSANLDGVVWQKDGEAMITLSNNGDAPLVGPFNVRVSNTSGNTLGVARISQSLSPGATIRVKLKVAISAGVKLLAAVGNEVFASGVSQ